MPPLWGYLRQLGLETRFLGQRIVDGLQEAPLHHVEGLLGWAPSQGPVRLAGPGEPWERRDLQAGTEVPCTA